MKTKLSQLPAIIRVLIPTILLADCFAAAGWERRVVPQNCGLLSLREVVKVLRPQDPGAVPITNGAIGEKGISLMDLAEVGRQLNLNLVPVRRLSGQDALINLAGWTPQEMAVKAPVAMHLNFPRLRAGGRFGEEQPQDEEALKEAQKNYTSQIDKLRYEIQEKAQKIVSESGGDDSLKSSAAERIKRLELGQK